MSSRSRRAHRTQVDALVREVAELRAKLTQAEVPRVPAPPKPTRKPRLAFADVVAPAEIDFGEPTHASRAYETKIQSPTKLSKSADAFRLNEDPAARLAFEVDPNDAIAQSVYIPKTRGVPDAVLRRIGIQESLVACILHARGHQMAAHGNPRRDRFSFGYTIQLTPAAQAELTTQQKQDLQPEIQRAIKILATCGKEDVPRRSKCTLGRWLYESTRDGLLLGRFATEIVSQPDVLTGEPQFQYFRPIDAATIYRVAPQGTDAARQVRIQSKQLLERIANETLPQENFLDRFFDDEFAWVQVINGQPMQAFTDDQCLVHALYPVTDVESHGYPLTPIDTAISEVTTRIAITTHNRLYFQSGRAAKGMIVINSEDVDDAILQDIRQKFSASINGVNNAHRLPVFALAPGDAVEWVAMDAPKDMEFQYLSDQNARTLLSVFQMSPEELPGYSHLSRGTSTQALSECLSPESEVVTESGARKLGEILGDRPEEFFEIWTGRSWSKARVFRSGDKVLCTTKLTCGTSVETSPDHRFMKIGDDGEPRWVHQEELAIGDYVLVNKKPIEGDPEKIPVFRDRRLTLEMAELLGWMTGDGTLVAPKKRAGGYVKLFYHSSKERDIWQRHADTLSKFGLDPHDRECPVDREKALADGRFNSVAPTRITNVVYSNEFVSWLFGMGFTPSSRAALGKSIPPILHVLPVEYRYAFLRGLFSADGHRIGRNHLGLTIQNTRLREQVRQLLLGLGIRTLTSPGIMRRSFGKKSFSYKLFIKDRAEFWEKIGFVQDHKQNQVSENYRGGWNEHDLPRSVAAKFARAILDKVPRRGTHEGPGLLNKKERSNLNTLLNPNQKRRASRRWIVGLMERCGLEVPEWLDSFHLEQVSELTDHGRSVAMVDVEVFDCHHGFVSAGFYLHNSNNEYILEAHRDLGIRPLIEHFQTFLTAEILPLISPKLARYCEVRLLGLGAESAEKESVRIQQDLPVHLTFNEVMGRVEKEPVPKKVAGDYPLNPQWQAVCDKMVPLNVQQAVFLAKDEEEAKKFLQSLGTNYLRDPFWWQMRQDLWQQFQMLTTQALPLAQFALPGVIKELFPSVPEEALPQVAQQMVMQAEQMMQMQQQAAAQGGTEGGDPSGGGDPGGGQGPPQQGDPQQEQQQPQDGGLGQDLQNAQDALGKSERQLGRAERRALDTHKRATREVLSSFRREARMATMQIIAEVNRRRG